jgi:flap endonuclease-1
MRLLKNHITPVFVFDGKPPKEKSGVIQNRKEKRNILVTKKNINEYALNIEKNNYDDFKTNLLNFIGDDNDSYIIEQDEIQSIFNKSNEELKTDIQNLDRKIIYVTEYHIKSSKELFDLLGIKYIHVDCEAEALLAMLYKNNIIDGCISEDTDVLVNGGYLFLRDFNADKNTVKEYCLHGILDNLKLKYEEFIDMCILCGCDYTTKINGIGPINAYKLIIKHKTIEEVFKNNNKYVIPDRFDYVKARELFKNPISQELFNNIDKNIYIKKPEIEKLIPFLKTYNLKEKIIKIIEKDLMNYYLDIEGISNNIHSPKKITDFFTPIKNM